MCWVNPGEDTVHRVVTPVLKVPLVVYEQPIWPLLFEGERKTVTRDEEGKVIRFGGVVCCEGPYRKIAQ